MVYAGTYYTDMLQLRVSFCNEASSVHLYPLSPHATSYSLHFMAALGTAANVFGVITPAKDIIEVIKSIADSIEEV